MTSVTPLSSRRLMPSGVYASTEMTWISKGPALPGFFAILLELVDEPVEFLGVGAAVHPAVESRRTLQRRVGVAADQDRNLFGGRRGHLGLGDVVELAMEFEVVPAGESLDDLDAFVHPLTAPGERDAQQLVAPG